MELEKEVWRNIRYQYNKEKDNIEEEELGTFTQYPIRLAWAITIHKSQGLTFNKAIIDAGASFAPGQVYVALSRLTSLDGLVLYSRIHPHCIQTDERALAFTRTEKPEDELLQQLQEDQKVFIARTLLQSFDWTKLSEGFREHYGDYEQLTVPDKSEAVQWAHGLLKNIVQQQDMAVKFTRQLEQLQPEAEQDQFRFLHQRIAAASEYFLRSLDETIGSIQQFIDVVKLKPKSRKYLNILRQLLLLPERKKQELLQAVRITTGLEKGENATDLLQAEEEQRMSMAVQPEQAEEKKPAKPPKGETRRISLQLFKEGKSIGEIATLRGMAFSTIESHLSSFITTGEIGITAIVDEKKLDTIMKTIDSLPPGGATPVKHQLGDGYSYGEIRAVMQYREWIQQTAGS